MTLRDRLRGAAAALAVQGLLGWLLATGLATSWRHVPERALAVFRLAPPPPPPPPETKVEHHRPSPRRSGTHSPPNLRATATDLVVPPPVIRPPLPPPVVAAPRPSTGAQASSGAAPVAGPGTGAGGLGNGNGGGGESQGGDDSRGGSPPRQIAGRLKDSDYPQAAALSGTSGIVGVRYLVGVDGRVGECRVVRPSGSAELDETTCRLIQQRFRFRPSRDEHGRKVPAWLIETHEWVIEKPPPPSS